MTLTRLLGNSSSQLAAKMARRTLLVLNKASIWVSSHQMLFNL